MREICMSGSEGGGAKFNWPSLPLSRVDRLNRPTSFRSISCRVGYADRRHAAFVSKRDNLCSQPGDFRQRSAAVHKVHDRGKAAEHGR